MPVRKAEAVWEGTLSQGKGVMKPGSGAIESAYSAGSRFREERGGNPDELVGAALAGCFAMALAGNLEKAGYTPGQIRAVALVRLDQKENGYAISRIDLHAEADLAGIPEPLFMEQAHDAKKNCPVSKALGVPIEFTVKLT